MAMEIVIDPSREETRVAVLEQQVLTELYIDRKRDRGIVGNVYKGRVVKVLPGMQSAFVDIGLERAAFLHVADVADQAEEPGDLMDEVEDEKIQMEPEPPKRGKGSAHAIEALLQEGQEIVVQVSDRKSTRLNSS